MADIYFTIPNTVHELSFGIELRDMVEPCGYRLIFSESLYGGTRTVILLDECGVILDDRTIIRDEKHRNTVKLYADMEGIELVVQVTIDDIGKTIQIRY